MKVAVVIATISTPANLVPIKKMSLIELAPIHQNDDYNILSRFVESLEEEYKVKDVRKARWIIHANIACIKDVDPEDSSDDICTNILLDEYFKNHLENKYII